MTVITGSAQRAAWLERRIPPVERVSRRVWSIPVACDPFPVRYTIAYALANDAGEFVLVDPGWDSPIGRSQLLAGLDSAGLILDQLVGIVVTHFHPDHIGMARAIADLTGAWIGMHPLDSLPVATEDSISRAIGDDHRWLEACGVPARVREELLLTAEAFRSFGRTPQVGVALQDGDRIALAGRDLTVMWTPGHSAGHLCLIDHDDALVLTGDHVLPRISPNVGIGFHDGDRDSVGEYLESLQRISAWDSFEVCPAHEWRFTGLAERCAELADHHEARSQEVKAVLAVSPSASVWEVAGQLTWSRGWPSLAGDNLRGALAETVAHVRHLERVAA